MILKNLDIKLKDKKNFSFLPTPADPPIQPKNVRRWQNIMLSRVEKRKFCNTIQPRVMLNTWTPIHVRVIYCTPHPCSSVGPTHFWTAFAPGVENKLHVPILSMYLASFFNLTWPIYSSYQSSNYIIMLFCYLVNPSWDI